MHEGRHFGLGGFMATGSRLSATTCTMYRVPAVCRQCLATDHITPMGSCGEGLSSHPLHQTYFNPHVQSWAAEVSAGTSHSGLPVDQSSAGDTCRFHSPSIDSRSPPSCPGRDDAEQPSDPEHPDSQSNMDIDECVDVDPEVPSGKFVEMYEGCSEAFPWGRTFMDEFWRDKHAAEQRENLYFPFTSREEWQFASWLLRSRLSLSAINSAFFGHRSWDGL
ncbi:hypothetical protein HD554DRAFT_2037830 [Boletus coccyginus]|nr:hypothetical protein HD554DRAFT_2037830 [Boletus coccyginus]